MSSAYLLVSLEIIFVPFSTGSTVFSTSSVVTLFSSTFLLIILVNKSAILLLSSTRLSITFKLLFWESELISTFFLSVFPINSVVKVESVAIFLSSVFFSLTKVVVLSLEIFLISLALLFSILSAVEVDSTFLGVSCTIELLLLLLFTLLSSCALAVPPKNTNVPIATDAIPKLSFFIPYFTIFLSILFLNIFPPRFHLKYMYLEFN